MKKKRTTRPPATRSSTRVAYCPHCRTFTTQQIAETIRAADTQLVEMTIRCEACGWDIASVQKKRWDKINEYGRTKAAALGITEKDVSQLVKEWRKEHRDTM